MGERNPYLTGVIDSELLKRRMVRATSWSQLFRTPEEADRDFLESVVERARVEAMGFGTFAGYTVQEAPEGALHTLFLRAEGRRHTFQRQSATGDVIIHYEGYDEPKETHITFAPGNIDHEFTKHNLHLPSNDVLEEIAPKGPTGAAGVDFDLLRTFLKGQYATEQAEQLFLFNGLLPERIGYRIYSHHALKLQSRIMQGYNYL